MVCGYKTQQQSTISVKAILAPYPHLLLFRNMPKDRTLKFRLSEEELTTLKRAAKLADIPVSILVRLCLSSMHHVATPPEVLRLATKEGRSVHR